MSDITTLKLRDLIVCKDHPDWGTWRVTKTPTSREDWYHIRGESGERVLDEQEYKRFWEAVA